MSKFVDIPNLPCHAKHIIIGEKYADFLSLPLKSLGISPIIVHNSPFVDERLSGHADMSVLHIKGESIVLAAHLRDTDFAANLTELGAKISYQTDLQGSKYPKDAGLNVCIVGDKLFYFPKSADNEIVSILTSAYHPISVKQGYTRCSICVVNDNALITADRGVADACNTHGIDCLLIEPGYVELQGYEYGFIGGAAFKISDDKLAFTGVLDNHPSKAAILGFLHNHGITPIFLTDLPIFDIGGAIPITDTKDG